MSTPVTHAAFPAEIFPFVIDFITVSDGLIVHTITVKDAGVLAIPPLADTYGPVRARITFADGEVME